MKSIFSIFLSDELEIDLNSPQSLNSRIVLIRVRRSRCSKLSLDYLYKEISSLNVTVLFRIFDDTLSKSLRSEKLVD